MTRLHHAIVIHILWELFSSLFRLIRLCIWILNGTQNCLHKNHQKSSYKETAQILTIWIRYRFDEGLPRTFGDFIATHEKFENPDYILKDNVTLYYITGKEAVFVELDKNIDITKIGHCGFMVLNQFEYARKLIKLPIHVFYQMAATIGEP